MLGPEKEKTEGEKSYTFREGRDIILQGLDRISDRLGQILGKLGKIDSSVNLNSTPRKDETPNKPVNK